MKDFEQTLQELRAILIAKGVIASDMEWVRQSGGRTNLVWRLIGDQDLICKLYLDASENPLYANTPRLDYECLVALDGQNVAPKPHGFYETSLGPVLIYEYVHGQIWKGDGGDVAELLQRVHDLTGPKELRILPDAPAYVLSQGLDILDKMKGDAVDEQRALAPMAVEVAAAPKALLHTDVVPGNLIYGSQGLCLIDWQCPALGDAVVDVAMFMSPAMHMIYGEGPLSQEDGDAFLEGLKPELQKRYAQVGRFYHWRMAAYCLWRAEQGFHGYSNAAIAETALLKGADSPCK